MNPFKYGQVVKDEDFCPRPKLLKDVGGFIKSGQNILIQGERRTGKTSLIFEALRRLRKRHIVYIDLLEVKSSDDLCKRIIKAVISLEQQNGVAEKLFKSLSRLKPTLSIDPLTGQPSISLDASVKLQPDSIEGILDMIGAINKRKALVVVFDEFQDILNLKDYKEALALLRSKIQFHSKIPYIFAGSVRNKMDDIFNRPDSAFFKSAISIDVGPIDRDQFVAFLKSKFSLGKRSVDQPVLNLIFEIAENVPGDIQQLCGAIWEITSYKDKIDESIMPRALQLIYAREFKGYEAILVQLTANQLKCLVGLAKKGGEAPLSSEFIKEVGITLSATIKKTLMRLIQLKIIYRYQNEYKFVNPFFKSWLLFKNL
jgi:AAA+ ATPase superfamily predicted ATPase